MSALPPGIASGEARLTAGLMRRFRITVAYDGTAYHGWQAQPGLPTIQGQLETVLAEIEGFPVPVHGSGRTDAGVHALGQVASFDLWNPIPADNLRRAMNRLLPRDIRITSVEEAPSDFHARFSAKAKTYEYRVWREEICPPHQRLYYYHHPYPLNVESIRQAVPLLEGEHDFSAFAGADWKDEPGYNKVRTLHSAILLSDSSCLIFRFRGSGFLKHMVRMLVGTLFEVGKGNLTRDDLLRRLEPGYAGKAGPSVPPSGLFLISVEY